MDAPAAQVGKKVKEARYLVLGALLFLSLLNLLNQVDRRALTTLFPLIKQEWNLSDAQLGLAVSFFTLGRAVIALPVGWLADRKGSMPILRPAAILWSALAALSGWAGSFTTFIAMRMGVGLMDGTNGPLDLAYLGKISPKTRRGLFLAAYSIALYIGSGLGVIFAGGVGERFGWRWALTLPGMLGLLAASGLLLLPKGEKPAQQEQSLPRLADFTWLLARPFPGIFVGGSLGVFASTALVSWLPSYLTRQFGLNLTQAGLLTGGIIIPASVLGTLLGGQLSDHLGGRDGAMRYRISVIGLFLAMVFGLAGLWVTLAASAITFFFISAVCFTLPVSPLLILVQESVPGLRLATAQAAFGLATQVLGAAPATGLVGLLSDQVGLRWALVLPFMASAVGGLIIAAGRKPGRAEIP